MGLAVKKEWIEAAAVAKAKKHVPADSQGALAAQLRQVLQQAESKPLAVRAA